MFTLIAITQADFLLTKVATYNNLENALNIRDNEMSDCTYITEPKLTVVDGRCVSIYEDEKVE